MPLCREREQALLLTVTLPCIESRQYNKEAAAPDWLYGNK
jgi:hypothetical protein